MRYVTYRCGILHYGIYGVLHNKDILVWKFSLQVRCSKGLTFLVLVLWTCSLMQFTIFIRPNQTTTHQTGLLKGYLGDDLSDNIRKEMLWAITTIGMQVYLNFVDKILLILKDSSSSIMKQGLKPHSTAATINYHYTFMPSMLDRPPYNHNSTSQII